MIFHHMLIACFFFFLVFSSLIFFDILSFASLLLCSFLAWKGGFGFGCIAFELAEAPRSGYFLLAVPFQKGRKKGAG